MSAHRDPSSIRAIRALIAGADRDDDVRVSIRDRAHELGVLGWVRTNDDGAIEVHAEGPADAVDSLIAALREFAVSASASPEAEPHVIDVRVEGHEQFAIRGVSAGVF